MEIKLALPCKWSHQPFLNEIHEKKFIFFCYGDHVIESTYGASTYGYVPWKILYGDWVNGIVSNIRPLATDFNSYDIECSPVFYGIDNKIFISFIGGKQQPGGEFVYKLYLMQGNSLENISLPALADEESVRCGFVNAKYLIKNWGQPQTEIYNLLTCSKQEVELSEFDTVQRIVPTPTIEESVLVTGKNKEKHKTMLFDLKKLTYSGEVIAGAVLSESIYKSCIFDNIAVYARKTNHEFEERELYYSSFNII